MDWLSSITQLIEDYVANWGYLAIFLLMTVESACIPVPSEITMPAAGFMAQKGVLNFFLVVTAGTMGNVVGSLITYYIGAKGGRPLLIRYGRYFLIREKELDRAESWFNRYGDRAIFFSRILPVIRTFISLPAGVARMDVKKFTLYTFLGSLPWALALTYLGYLMGAHWTDVEKYFRRIDLVIISVIVLAILIYIWRKWRRKS